MAVDPSTEPAQVGLGTTLGFKKAADQAYTTLGTIQDLDGPSITIGEAEATRLNSKFKPYAPTLPEGEGSFTVQHISGDPGIQALRAMLAKAPIPYVSIQITYPDGWTETFPGFFKGYQIQSVEAESIITATVPYRMTDSSVVAPPAGGGN